MDGTCAVILLLSGVVGSEFVHKPAIDPIDGGIPIVLGKPSCRWKECTKWHIEVYVGLTKYDNAAAELASVRAFVAQLSKPCYCDNHTECDVRTTVHWPSSSGDFGSGGTAEGQIDPNTMQCRNQTDCQSKLSSLSVDDVYMSDDHDLDTEHFPLWEVGLLHSSAGTVFKQGYGIAVYYIANYESVIMRNRVHFLGAVENNYIPIDVFAMLRYNRDGVRHSLKSLIREDNVHVVRDHTWLTTELAHRRSPCSPAVRATTTTTTVDPPTKCKRILIGDGYPLNGLVEGEEGDEGDPWSITIVGAISAHNIRSESVFEVVRRIINDTVLQCIRDDMPVDRVRIVTEKEVSPWFTVSVGLLLPCDTPVVQTNSSGFTAYLAALTYDEALVNYTVTGDEKYAPIAEMGGDATLNVFVKGLLNHTVEGEEEAHRHALIHLTDYVSLPLSEESYAMHCYASLTHQQLSIFVIDPYNATAYEEKEDPLLLKMFYGLYYGKKYAGKFVKRKDLQSMADHVTAEKKCFLKDAFDGRNVTTTTTTTTTSMTTDDATTAAGDDNGGVRSKYTPYTQSSSTIVVIVTTSALLIVVLLTIIALFFWLKHRNQMLWQKRVSAIKLTRQPSTTSCPGGRPSFDGIDEWEVPKEDVKVFYDHQLGSGAFGTVFKGILTHARTSSTVITSQQVAVKMLPRHACAKSKSSFVAEMHLMKVFHNQHIVRLVGCVTIDEPLCLLTEFCAHGDLGVLLAQSRFREHQPLLSIDQPSPTQLLSPKDLLSFAWQISDGMAYLAAQAFVHRDLAARNVLVDKDMCAKIGDFGSCRRADQSLVQTVRDGNMRMAIKWMAPEVLQKQEFSSMADVWSFGVVLYEIFGMSRQPPYEHIELINMAIYVSTGGRLPRPPYADATVYSLMTSCWTLQSLDRPSFQQIRADLAKMLDGVSEQYGYLSCTPTDVPFATTPSHNDDDGHVPPPLLSRVLSLDSAEQTRRDELGGAFDNLVDLQEEEEV